MFDPIGSGYPLNDVWPVGTGIPVVWYVEDDQGHSYSFNYLLVHTVDTTPPVFDLTGVSNPLFLSSVVQVPPLGPLPATDNCTASNNLTQTFTETPRPDTCDAGSFTRTWRVTDQSGNTTTFTQTIQITVDNLSPIIMAPFPANGSSPCEDLPGAYQTWLATQTANFNATDPSGILSLTNNAPVDFPAGCPGPVTVTFVAKDNCLLVTFRTVTFSTSDTEAPQVTTAPKDTVAYCAVNGSQITRLGEWINTRGYSQISDACTGVTFRTEIDGSPVDSAQIVAALLASYANGCNTDTIGSQIFNKVRGLVTVDWYAADACGNETFAGQSTFGVIDTLPPVITGVNVTEECGATAQDNSALQSWINAHGNTTITDECSEISWANFTFVTSTGQSGTGLFNSGPYPQVQAHNCNWWADVTFRAFDGCGNLGLKTLRFQIEDNTDPVIAGFQDTIMLACPNPVPTLSTQFVSDNCDTSLVIGNTIVRSDSLCDGSYTMTVTWSATDDCGNTGIAVQTVLVRDTIAPIFTLVPANKTFRCDTFLLPAVPVMGVDINATDNCSPVTGITTQTVSNQNPDPNTCGYYTYQITRTFTATDECNNTRTATQVISVVDSLGPVFAGYTDTTGVCDVAPVLPIPIATDACSGITATPDTVSVVTTPGLCPNSYTLTITWIARDVCNNSSTFTQNIAISDTVRPVLTNIPPNVTVSCDAIPLAPNVSTFNATDNCDNAVDVTLLETELRNPDPNNCDHWTNYVIRREWTATDNCGNTRKYTQNILIQDNTPPQLVAPAALALPNDPGECGRDFTIPPPVSVFDICTSLPVPVVLRDTVMLVKSAPGLPGETPVDTVVFQWNALNIAPAEPVTGSAALRIYLDNADADLSTETFTILGENNTPLGITTLVTPAQCGSGFTDVTIPAALLNNWLQDGILTLRLAPNNSGGDAVNAVCMGGSFARAQLQYTFADPQVPVALKFSLDASPAQPFPAAAPFFLAPGLHTIVYTATDCAGNEVTASSTVTVSDQEPPVITPPPTQTAYLQAGECETVVTLPFPAISDNCDVSGSLTQASAILPLKFSNDPNAGLIPNMVTLTISGLVPNAVSGGVLKIRHKGDNDQVGEFFKVLDENNVPLPNTSYGTVAGVCTEFHETLITVSAAQINNWAANGTTTIKLVANNEAGTFFEFIGPCGPLMPDQTDGISRIQAVLEYSFAVVTYEIRNSADQLVQTGGLNGGETNVVLSPDTYSVDYLTSDVHGLEGSTTYQLNVLDTIRPTAICQPTTIYVNPSGAPGSNYTLLPSEIDNGSTDNCPGSLIFQLSPNVFTCAQASNNFNVTLTVTDSSGNSASCTTIVRVENALPMPTYSPVCEGGVLQLMANPPAAAPNAFTYLWNGPNGYMSTSQNPIRNPAQLSHEGLYSVKITGLTGCMSTGFVTVDLTNLPNQPMLSVTNSTLCSGDNIVLTTPTYPGGSPLYQWFLGVPGNSVLLATLPLPTFTLSEADSGAYQFYVKVSASGCLSLNSEVLTVIVSPRPTAQLDQEVINVCEGQPIILGTPSTGTGMTYHWTGPGGFEYFVQNPPPILSAAPFNAGTYTLVVTQNGCVSKPATVQVIVRPKPAKPFLSGSNQVCEGANITLLASTPTAAQYVWQAPNQSLTNTTVNSLALPGVMVSDSGAWKVRVVQQGCLSDWSDSLFIRIQQYPDVTGAATLNPICAGGILNLQGNANISNLNWCWTGPSPFISYQQFVTITPAVAGMYKVVGKTSFGCSDSAFVNVQVIQAPVIDTIIYTAPICSDGSTDAVLTPMVSSSNGPFTYEWVGPNGLVISSAQVLVIPDVTTTNNGPYKLTVRDVHGCTSVSKTTTVNVGPPLVIPLLNQHLPVCVGTPVTISVTNAGQYNPSAKFIWVRPNGDTLTTQSFLSFPNAQVWQSGVYSVYVNDGICKSDTSAPVIITVNAIPAAPVLTSNSPVCEGDVLQLNAAVVAGATYNWTGPVDFTSSNSNPTRQPVILSYAGTYNTTITVNGCSSPASHIEVEVIARPKKPVIIPTVTTVCIDQPGATLTLTLTNVTPGSQYVWLNEIGDTLAGPLSSVSVTFTHLDTLFTAGSHTFRAVAWKNGCDSEVSNSFTISFDTIPNNTAFAGMDGPICTALPFNLGASPPASGTGLWSQLGTPAATIASPGSPNSTVTGMTPGNMYQFIWTLSSGGCTNYSRDTVTLTAQALEIPNGGPDLYFCDTSGIHLNAVQGQVVSGFWTQPSSQVGLGIVISNPLDPNTLITGLTPGNKYFFSWNMGNAGCGNLLDEVAVHTYSRNTNAGPDQFLCNNQDCTLLDASNPLSFEFGIWTSLTPGINISTPSSDQTTICGLQPGPNVLLWTINNDICGMNSHDTIVVNFELFPTANPDALDVIFGSSATVNVLSNDVVPNQYSVEITVPPVHGRITDTAGLGMYVYQPNSNFSGTDQMEYEICNLRCPDACSYTTVVFNIAGPGDCFLPNVITPNGDDMNDAFIIPETCVSGEGGVEVEVTIFNQWGDQVFHALPYLNDWEGTYNGNPLPAGTYFYVVQFSDPLYEAKKGFLILQK
ncbi:MAG TPA: gliding motility-associated C-terminal domain-containing protein [Saprospiraceae bacterium]|nr:gliding motility-associated C-terminal domain-containing protein [Saprospiraceae bacterium]